MTQLALSCRGAPWLAMSDIKIVYLGAHANPAILNNWHHHQIAAREKTSALALAAFPNHVDGVDRNNPCLTFPRHLKSLREHLDHAIENRLNDDLMATKLEILKDVSLGQRVAEEEADDLLRYFVKTDQGAARGRQDRRRLRAEGLR